MPESPPLPSLGTPDANTLLPIWSSQGGTLYLEYAFQNKEIHTHRWSIIRTSLFTALPLFLIGIGLWIVGNGILKAIANASDSIHNIGSLIARGFFAASGLINLLFGYG